MRGTRLRAVRLVLIGAVAATAVLSPIGAVSAFAYDPPVITSPLPDAVIGGTTLPVRGTGTPGATAYVRLDQQPLRTVTVAPDRSWATDYTGVLDGTHLVTVSDIPDGGNISSTKVRLDSTPPTGILVLITNSPNPGLIDRRRVYLRVESSELLRGIRVSNDGGPFGDLVPPYGLVPWLVADLDGTRRVSVQLEDVAGNVSQSDIAATVTLERVAPRVIRTSPAAGAVHVRRDKVVSAHFDDSVIPNAGTSLSYLARIFRVGTDKPIRATVRYDAASATVRVLPSHLLRQHTRYQVVVYSGFHDLAGNVLDQDPAKRGTQQMVWRFRTR
jgi:hypothetical protein